MKTKETMLLMFLSGIFLFLSPAYSQKTTILDNIFTLELTFGDKNLPDEYLLARPSSYDIAAAPNGDIIVPDEYKLKIFDSNGKPKKIVGGQGQGPGEFTLYPIVSAAINGNICAITPDYINVYNNQYEFVNSKNLKNDPVINQYVKEKGFQWFKITRIIPFSQEDMLIYASNKPALSTLLVDKNVCYSLLLYKSRNDLFPVVESLSEEYYNDGKMLINIPVPETGRLIYTELPGKMIAFSDSRIDKIFENSKWYYFIYTYDIANRQKKTLIKREYEPAAFPDSLLHPEKAKGYNGNDIIWSIGNRSFTRKEMNEKKTEILNKLKYFPPISNIFYDNNVIFVRLNMYEKNKGYVVEIFDSETGKYLRSAYFPFMPVVNNGCAYRIIRGGNVFPYIEKYKINPAVYGK